MTRKQVPVRHIPAELRAAAREAIELGWTISRTGSGHLLWVDARGQRICTTPSTPGQHNRSTANSKSHLRRGGLTCV